MNTFWLHSMNTLRYLRYTQIVLFWGEHHNRVIVVILGFVSSFSAFSVST